jgi:hypothetical protein
MTAAELKRKIRRFRTDQEERAFWHVTAWRSSQEILKISTSSFVARARNRSRCVSIRMTSKLSDRLPRSTVSDTPRWRDQFSKGGWRAREAGAAEDTVGKLAGLLNDCHPQPRATPAQPAGLFRSTEAHRHGAHARVRRERRIHDAGEIRSNGGWRVHEARATEDAHDGGCAMRRRAMKKKAGVGSSFDDFLRKEGIYEVTEAIAINRLRLWENRMR